MAPEPSILLSTKKMLGLAPEYDVFDLDVITLINGVFSTLNQLGVGPAEGFSIEDDDATWDDFLQGDELMNSVKSYVYLKVRMTFDPPTTSFTQTAFLEQAKELEWRLNVVREVQISGYSLDDSGVYDGGAP